MSHTATGEWKSFEIRMRRRRAERLVLRADIATEAGCFEDAHACIDEARRLWTSVPGLSDVESRLHTAETTPAVPACNLTRRVMTTAAAVIVLGATAAATAVLWPRLVAHDDDVHVMTQPVAAALVNASPQAAAPDPAPAPSATDSRNVSVPDNDPPGEAASLTARQPVAEQISSTLPLVSAMPSVTARASQLPAVTRGRMSVSDAVTQPASDGTPAVQPVSLRAEPGVDQVRLAAAPLTSTPAVATDGAESITIEPPQDAMVRGALENYAAAYSRLDADAAQRVWPMVNVDALSRAFDTLASQRVSLGDCRIQVNGASAQAQCAGTATWTPKVGGGERTDDRSWTFELSKANGRWEIVSARVQNR
jgi:hypothetical protein